MHQDDMAVGWDPATSCGQLPILERLFVMGLLCIAIWVLVKIVELIVRLRVLSKVKPAGEEPIESRFWLLWEGSMEIASSFKGLALWTTLIGGAVTAQLLIDSMRVVAQQKLPLSGVVFASVMESLRPLRLGLWSAVVLYAVGAGFQALLGKRRLRRKYGE